MESLKRAVVRYADGHANLDGLASTPVDGLRSMCATAPSGPMHSVYKPLICFILQGAKRMTIGGLQHCFHAGESALVTLDMPVAARIVEASRSEPYLAVAVELDLALVREIDSEMPCASDLGRTAANRTGQDPTLFVLDTDAATLDCAARLFRLLDTPEAIGALRPAILKELHFWLLSGRHGDDVRRLSLPDSQAARLGSAIRLLRSEFRHRLSLPRLAAASGMSVSTFGRRFKAMTTLSPLQFQKQLRLVEARRLMLTEGASVTEAALAVGYESPPHFTHDYVRLFGSAPLRDRQQAARAIAARAAG